jgi:alpha-2-macroglobulin
MVAMKRWMPALALILMTLLFAGCGGKDEGTPPDVQKANAAQGDAATSAFMLVSGTGESYEGRPSIVLDFSRALVGQQAFDQLLSIKLKDGANAEGSWMLDGDSKRLRFPYLEADKTYVVTLRGTLAAADGSQLGADKVQEVYSGNQEPIVGFASQGSILPAHESRGLPIVAVNVAEVDIEFFKVSDRNLGKFLTEYQQNGRRSYWSLEQLGKMSTSVYKNRFALQSKSNERNVSFIPIRDIDELNQSGLYFAVLNRAGSFGYEQETAMFFVSDIGLHVRAYKDRMLVLSTSLESGAPKPNVALQIQDETGAALFDVTTDSNGLAMIEYTPNSQHLLTARFGNDISLLPFNQPALDLSEFSLGGRAQTDLEIFPWSGRDLYRPGETLGVSALLRDFDGKMVKAQPLFVTLKQPDGRAVSTTQIEPGELNYVRYEREIPADAPTGLWSLDLSTDPTMTNAATFAFHVEEFLPERLKLTLDAPPSLAPGDTLPLSVEGAWLYGSPAAGNRFTARLSLQPDSHPVDTLKDFHFGDPLAELPKQPKDVLDEKLDEEGKLSSEIALDEVKAPTGTVAVIVSGSLYESGGRAVTRIIKRSVWPAAEIVGARPLFDMTEGATPNGEAGFEVVRANAAGELLSGSKLKVKLLRDRREYNWRWVDGGGWRSDFLSHWETAGEQELNIKHGERAKISFPVEWGGYRLEVFDPTTALTMKMPFEAGWNWYNEGQDAGSRPDKVKLALDKPSYKEGDTVELTIKPPHPGNALVLIESDHLLWQKLIEVKNETTIEIPLDKTWLRHDLYASVLVFRPGDSAEKITPSRAVGLQHIPLDRSTRKLAVTIDAVKKTRPDQKLQVVVHAPQLAGKPARVALHAVDVGILNLTQFPMPDPTGWFFAPRRFVTNAYDLFGRIIEAVDGNKAKLRYGGDAAMLALPQARRPNVKVLTVDMFERPVLVDAQGDARFELTLPDFNGTVRLGAVVYGEQNYGTASQETIIQAPLVVEVSAPRAMASGDSAEIALDLENLSGAEGNYSVTLEGGDMLAITEPKRSVKLADKARSTQTYKIVAREKYGVASVIAKVTGGTAKVERRVEFALRPAYPAEHRSRSTVLDQGRDIGPDSALRAGLVPDSVISRMTLGTLPPLPFASVVKDLIQYPYGCVEQTTSKAFPLVFLDDDTAKRFGVTPLKASERTEMLNVAFSRLASMQTENGHFSYWPGDSYVVTHMTPYVAEMLVTAKEAGFSPNEAMLEKTLKRLNDDLLSGGNPHYDYEHSDHLRIAEQAHAGYVLAKLKRAPLGTLRAIFDNERSKLVGPLPLVHLGAALAMQGDRTRAEAAIKEAFDKKWERPRWIGDYGSPLRDLTLMVAIVNEVGLSKPEYDARVYDMAREMMGRQNDRWSYSYLSTQEQIAIFRLGRALMGDMSRKIEGDVRIGGNSEPFNDTAQVSRNFVIEDLNAGVILGPRGPGPIFVVEDVVGYPASAPEVKDEHIAIRRKYYRQDGTEYDGAALTTGEALVVVLDVTAKEEMKDALIVDLLPGGLELENLNLGDQSIWEGITIDGVTMNDRSGQAEIRYEEYRDDRYVAAVQLYGGQQSKLFYIVRAVSPGKYKVPTPMIEDMYRPMMRGIGAAVPASIEVREPK